MRLLSMVAMYAGASFGRGGCVTPITLGGSALGALQHYTHNLLLFNRFIYSFAIVKTPFFYPTGC